MRCTVWLLLLLLSRFSRVQLCATPRTAAYQASPSMGFSRQEHWSGLPFPLQCMKVKKWKEAAQSYPILSNPMDCSLPGSSTHGIFQVRVLELGAIAFSVAWSLIIVFSHPGDWHVLEVVLWESTGWACKSFTFTENANLKLVSIA